jgi:hypothetical protein
LEKDRDAIQNLINGHAYGDFTRDEYLRNREAIEAGMVDKKKRLSELEQRLIKSEPL